MPIGSVLYAHHLWTKGRRKDNSGVITGCGDAASAAAYLPLITADYQSGGNGLVEPRGQVRKGS